MTIVVARFWPRFSTLDKSLFQAFNCHNKVQKSDDYYNSYLMKNITYMKIYSLLHKLLACSSFS